MAENKKDGGDAGQGAGTRVRVESFTISLDGYGAGTDQSLDSPLGIGGESLHEWVTSTRSWRQMHEQAGGSEGVDNDFAMRGNENIGAWIIGRNMFGPVRGPWPDERWKGWWGDNPPYHVPVYVLTHYARPPLEMEGGTTFYFVTEGIHAALDRAREAAIGKDIRIGGGADTIQQYLREGLIDELHIAIAPTLLGKGEGLFGKVDWHKAGYECTRFGASEKAMHIILQRKPDA
ncbi:dihydrofolate reductase family protein [Ravibacter arvi]|uniref:Dihydrofolate reductase family protein n=1 Tax=Ravibacter arvi TaxID=2051041 RepID=A0ABP8M2K8_9BACT